MQRKGVKTLALVMTGLVIVVGYSAVNRALRFDEVVQFALGGLPPGEAWNALVSTLGDGLNHGQTGAYFVVDYALMQVFGANLLALRLPSLVSGVILLVSAVVFLRARGLPFFWQWLVMVAIAAQFGLMFYAGDARPYMVYAASAVAMLAYYQFPVAHRRTWLPLLLGIYGIVVGALNHPYFIMFFVLVLGYSVWVAGFDRGHRLGFSEMVRLADPWLVVPGLLIFFGLASVTWLTGNPVHGKDPWQAFGGAADGLVSLAASHLGVLSPLQSVEPVPFLLVALALGVVLAVPLLALPRRRLMPPLVLFGVGLGSSVVLVALSVYRDYWVFNRQWVGGIAIATIAFTWYLAEAASAAQTVGNPRIRVGVGVVIALLLVNASLALMARVLEFRQNQVAWQAVPVLRSDPQPDTALFVDGDWVDYANSNIASGGPVWAGVARYYEYWVPSLKVTLE